ncbi:MFS general substrate transporter [Karstenula rhodostoma CBS 690.94]|uniref:MFS general substrate transporter n=1 Tax=Karstenula rhodostoma CBS 690.94 TaxID=1392251 RepID=A0A9P4PI63_9PLEO|nr:MFS general substrate transporter [Karstenula rhodostoma CBS 690.94]
MAAAIQSDGSSDNAATPAKARHPPIPLWKLVTSQSAFTPDVLEHTFPGSGTIEDPYRVEWIPDDSRNPLIMPNWIKWMITVVQAFAFLSITFASSAMSAADPQLEEHFGASSTLVIADTSLFILAFAIGPAVWAPLSELYGRQVVCILTYALTTLFSGAVIASNNIATVLVLRFFSGAFGASAITNSGGVVSDMFSARDRAVAMLAFIGAPFLGPSIAPIACNYLAVGAGWQWVAALITFFVGTAFIGILFVPETYHPVLLRRRAAKLSKITGKVYKSKLDDGKKTPAAVFNTAMVRPWALLFREPIVLFLSLYMAIIYGTMYMEFAAFPIVFAGSRGWKQANSGLAFVGMGVGQIIGVFISYFDNTRYKRVIDHLPEGTTLAPPEARLFPSLIGAVLLPVALFEFAWTNYPSIHWIACQIGTVGLGISHVLIFLSVANYLVDTYTLYAASALAANTIIRALFGAAFPLFTTPMYDSLGIHWGSSIPAFLALACAPFPYLFHTYGPRVRRHGRYAAESARIMDELHNKPNKPQEASESELVNTDEKKV